MTGDLWSPADETSRDQGQREILQLRVGELRQFFNAMDPAPFHERDLDPNADAYITSWARDISARRPLGLSVHLTRERATVDMAAMLREAVHQHFRERGRAARRELRQLLRLGRMSLLIGLAFLAAALSAGEFLAGLLTRETYASLARESLVIGGWVALWRPLEIFLYDWWPIRDEARLYDRLSGMGVWLGDTVKAGDLEP